MVSEWMDNGNVMEYIRKDPVVNRIELVRVHSNLTGLWLTWLVNGHHKWSDVYAQP
jgi:hypothetical protein